MSESNISDTEWLVISIAMFGKFAITTSFSMAWAYSIEIYPTSIRSLGVNACSTAARVSGIASAYIGVLVSIECNA